MRIQLETNSSPKRGRKLVRRFFGWVIFVMMFIAALIWWQGDNLPEQIVITLPKQPLAPLFSPTSTASTASSVELVYSAVIQDEGQIFTPTLYLEPVEHIDPKDWALGRTEIETYIVQPGDTVWGIAVQFDLDLETLIWSNPILEENPDYLQPDMTLIILPLPGIYHTVADGETLEQIARQYGVSNLDIANYPLNDLVPPYPLKPGERLVVPNGQRDIQVIAPDLAKDYPLAWPLIGLVSQGYSDKHPALDIKAAYGAEVYAADDGIVVQAAWAETGYGFTVIIDHGQNRYTLYSHLKETLVKLQQSVNRGQVIGQVGSMGNTTGPHLHFEVQENGRRINPLNYLNPNF